MNCESCNTPLKQYGRKPGGEDTMLALGCPTCGLLYRYYPYDNKLITSGYKAGSSAHLLAILNQKAENG